MKNLIITMIVGTMLSTTIFAQLQNYRPLDKSGLNMFETPKNTGVKFDGLKVKVGGNFAQQFQMLSHENGNVGDTLFGIAPGFNLATANLVVDVQLNDGIALKLDTYLSSRNHSETWVKGGYVQIDKLPFGLDGIMKYSTIKVGHMEINYGDQHFRRTDNGNAFYNPFVGNLILDAFATEIGGEYYFKHPSGFMAMVGLTNGEIKGNTQDSEDRGFAVLAKVAYDKQLNDDLRFRLSASMYNANTTRITLYGGDRTGSRYYNVLVKPDGTGDFRTGRLTADLNNETTAIQINPFLKWKGLELFGVYEIISGKKSSEDADREFNQMAIDLLYRFGENEDFYLGGRYNKAGGTFAGKDYEISATRMQFAAGWFVTDNLMLKVEYVDQSWDGYPEGDILYEGKFDGAVIEAAVSF